MRSIFLLTKGYLRKKAQPVNVNWCNKSVVLFCYEYTAAYSCFIVQQKDCVRGYGWIS